MAVVRRFSVLAMFLMFLMRRMRNFAQIKLRKKNENKRLNKRHKDAQRHQQ